MNTKEKICQAIERKLKIVYNVGNYGDKIHVPGERFGNPHIVYNTKNGYTMVHIWKTGGVQTDPEKTLPGWRNYHLGSIESLEILEERFSPSESFNSQWKGYSEIICSVA